MSWPELISGPHTLKRPEQFQLRAKLELSIPFSFKQWLAQCHTRNLCQKQNHGFLTLRRKDWTYLLTSAMVSWCRWTQNGRGRSLGCCDNAVTLPQVTFIDTSLPAAQWSVRISLGFLFLDVRCARSLRGSSETRTLTVPIFVLTAREHSYLKPITHSRWLSNTYQQIFKSVFFHLIKITFFPTAWGNAC